MKDIGIELNKANKRTKTSRVSKSIEEFEKYMDDDLNTSGALSILFELSQPINKLINILNETDIKDIENNHLIEIHKKWELLTQLAGVLGLQANLNNENSKSKISANSKEVEDLINERSLAKSNKDFALADKIRNQLKDLGIELIDKSNGITEWKNSSD